MFMNAALLVERNGKDSKSNQNANRVVIFFLLRTSEFSMFSVGPMMIRMGVGFCTTTTTRDLRMHGTSYCIHSMVLLIDEKLYTKWKTKISREDSRIREGLP